MKSLSEVEQYINSNKHLPDVTSTKEVETNGLDLAQMNHILLKKIEELTLYVIQQQKDIKSLQDEIEKMKSDK